MLLRTHLFHKEEEMGEQELFLIDEGEGKYLLYAPLRRAAAVVNARTAEIVADYIDNGQKSRDKDEQEILDRLTAANLIGGEAPQLPAFPKDYGFQPYEVTLFLTTRCNLRCRYCYAEGGTRQEELSWAEARAAIDQVVENALLTEREVIIVGFHGGGEPTLAWPMLKRCVVYAIESGKKNNLNVNIHAATNGILNKEQREFILKHFTGINVSFDGPEDIQNHNRPFADGSGSFDHVMQSLKFFDRNNFEYSIRATVTSNSVTRMAETIEFLGTNLPALKQVHIEPLWMCGRCHTSGEIPPEPQVYVSSYLEAEKTAKELGINLTYSGARLDTLSNRFCGAPGEGFSVIPGGSVTSCFEVCEVTDPRSELFHYGTFDHATGRYVFDQEKIQKLRKFSVDNIAFCSDCFVKWHCAGDCLAKALKDFTPQGHAGSNRCGINREITLAQIRAMFDGNTPSGGFNE
jgi:uncharacterized protein